MDRKLILAGIVLVSMFFAVSFDPLGLSKKFSAENAIEAGTTSSTGLVTAGNIYQTVLPGAFFLALITLFYYFAREQAGEQ
ncbi:MAG: hypothetical protein ABIG96_04185 [Candidatus Micrarchaeota archaeon]